MEVEETSRLENPKKDEQWQQHVIQLISMLKCLCVLLLESTC
jgi:hypothetical protein